MNIINSPWILEDNVFSMNRSYKNEADFVLGNRLLKQKGCCEEFFSGMSCPESNMSGIYTINADGQPKLSNLPDWASVQLTLNAEVVDLAVCEIKSYRRSLNLKNGLLERSYEVITPAGYHIEAIVQRFMSQSDPEVGAIRYYMRSLGFEGKITFKPVIDGAFPALKMPDIAPEWNVLQTQTLKEVAHLWIQTRHTNFQVCEALSYDFLKNNAPKKLNPTKIEKQKVAGFSLGIDVKANEYVCLYKYISVLNSNDHPYKELTARAQQKALEARDKGWNTLLEENTATWQQLWNDSTPSLPGSLEDQQHALQKIFLSFLP